MEDDSQNRCDYESIYLSNLALH